MTLPSGKLVFGLGDAVVVNDPVTGQGSNNATKRCLMVYLTRRARIAALLGYAVRPTLLLPPPPHPGPHGRGANRQLPASSPGFNHPPSYFPWWSDAAEAGELLKRHQAVARAA